MLKFYLLPIDIVVIDGKSFRGPKYFAWRFNPSGINCRWDMMDYGFVNFCLLLAHDITQLDHDNLILNIDVWSFPDLLDSPVDQDIQPFFEGINLPTDWLTPSTSFRELLRQVAGMMQFNQRYGGISNGHSIFENADLNTRLRQMTAEEQQWFLLTVASFGVNPDLVNLNSQLRLLVRQAGDYWAQQSFYLGGYEF